MPHPLAIELRKTARVLYISFNDGTESCLCFDRLRDLSPAADGAPPAPSRDIAINNIIPVGNYAVRLVFSDGHDSGIYSWEFLHRLAKQCPIQ